jgi:hypothetical protein
MEQVEQKIGVGAKNDEWSRWSKKWLVEQKMVSGAENGKWSRWSSNKS